MEWVKIKTDLLIEMRGLPALYQWCWVGVLLLVGRGELDAAEQGLLRSTPGLGKSDEEIADWLSVSKDDWCSARDYLKDTGRISLLNNGIIRVTRWDEHQGRYFKDKKYREGKRDKDDTEDYAEQSPWVAVLKKAFKHFKPKADWLTQINEEFGTYDLVGEARLFVDYWRGKKKPLSNVPKAWRSWLQNKKTWDEKSKPKPIPIGDNWIP